MSLTKLEIDMDSLNSNSCFLCLQSILPINNSANLFFKHLKIRCEIEAFVCEKCGENLSKYVRLCNILEKVRLEMDYLLDFIKGVILNSKANDPVYSGMISTRQMVLEKCLEMTERRKPHLILERLDPSKLGNYFNDYNSGPSHVNNVYDQCKSASPTPAKDTRVPQIVLQRLDLTKLIKREGLIAASDCSEDWLQNLDDLSSSSSSDDGKSSTPAIPVVNKIINIKSEVDFDEFVKTIKRENNDDFSLMVKYEKCQKTFNSKAHLKHHNDAAHLSLKTFKCHTCSKLFRKKAHLQRHINFVHLSLKPFICDLCDKSFKSGDALRAHKTKPHNPKPEIQNPRMFSCKICEKSFKNLDTLRAHKYVHMERRFPCEICEKKFKRRCDLKTHVLSIHEKRRHHCQVEGCNNTFSHTSRLGDHYRLEHPDFIVPPKPKVPRPPKVVEKVERVIDCRLCPYKFKSVEMYRKHKFPVHKKSNFFCVECGFTSAFKMEVDAHIQSVHEISPEFGIGGNEGQTRSVKSESNSISWDEFIQ